MKKSGTLASFIHAHLVFLTFQKRRKTLSFGFFVHRNRESQKEATFEMHIQNAVKPTRNAEQRNALQGKNCQLRYFEQNPRGERKNFRLSFAFSKLILASDLEMRLFCSITISRSSQLYAFITGTVRRQIAVNTHSRTHARTVTASQPENYCAPTSSDRR